MADAFKGNYLPDIPSAFRDNYSIIPNQRYMPYNNETETAVMHIQNELYHVSSDKMYFSRSPSSSGYSEGPFSSSSSRYCSATDSPFSNDYSKINIPSAYKDDYYLESCYDPSLEISDSSIPSNFARLEGNDMFAPFYSSSPECESSRSPGSTSYAPIPATYRDPSNKTSIDIFEEGDVVYEEYESESDIISHYEDCCSSSSSVSEVIRKKPRMDFGEKKSKEADSPDCNIVEPTSLIKSQSLGAQSTASFEEANVIFSYNDNVVCIPDFADDVYKVLYNTEMSNRLGHNFMSAQTRITENRRKQVIASYIKAQKVLKLTKETLHLAAYLFDRCLDTFCLHDPVAKDIAAVVLVLASKIEEYNPLTFSAVINAGLTTSSTNLLSRCERRVFYELKFSLSHPTPFIFANYFHFITNSKQKEVLLTNYILELCLLKSCYRDWGGPKIAHAAVLLAHLICCDQDVISHAFLLSIEKLLCKKTFISPKTTRSLMKEMLFEINMATQEEFRNQIWQSYNLKDVVPRPVPKIISDILEN